MSTSASFSLPAPLYIHFVTASFLRFLRQLDRKGDEVAMASTWCSQGRRRGARRAARGPGNGGAVAGRQPGGLGSETGGSRTCSRAAALCRGRGPTVPQCKPWVLGSCRIYVEACYCFAGILCAGCLLLLACWRQGQVTRVKTPAPHRGPSPGQWRWQPWETRGTALAQKGRVPKGWDWESAGTSLCERLLKKLKPLFLSLPLLLSFPSNSACPPSRQPFVDT